MMRKTLIGATMKGTNEKIYYYIRNKQDPKSRTTYCGFTTDPDLFYLYIKLRIENILRYIDEIEIGKFLATSKKNAQALLEESPEIEDLDFPTYANDEILYSYNGLYNQRLAITYPEQDEIIDFISYNGSYYENYDFHILMELTYKLLALVKVCFNKEFASAVSTYARILKWYAVIVGIFADGQELNSNINKFLKNIFPEKSAQSIFVDGLFEGSIIDFDMEYAINNFNMGNVDDPEEIEFLYDLDKFINKNINGDVCYDIYC